MSLHCTEISRCLPPAKSADWTAIIAALSIATLVCFSSTTFSQTNIEQPAPEQVMEPTAIAKAKAKAKTARPKTVEPIETRDMNLLADEMNDQETVAWLTAADGKFLSLYEPEWNNNPFGAVLILHAEGQHADWPTTIEIIRSSLPQYGWSTLSTSLPNPDTTPIPQRLIEKTATTTGIAAPADKDTPENSDPVAEAGEENEIFDAEKGTVDDGALEPEQDSERIEKPKIATETVAYSRIEAAISYLNDQGIYNIVLLGDGVGAARAGNFLKGLPQSSDPKENTIKVIRAMVIINARNSSPTQDINLLSSLYDPEVATLDIYFGTHERDNIESLERKKFAMRNNFSVYQQILLPELSRNTTNGENRLAKRIRGFLSKYAKGVKVEDAIVNKQ